MSVIDEVRREREDLARVLKKHTGIRRIVEDLYPDSAHFIYELLQNAEDAGATEAHFTLTNASLVFEHDGRPFEPRDIYAITDIGEGTKAGDDDKIGRFGVGFKAVFAYSETPHIWSPTFCFKIAELVLPHEIAQAVNLGSRTQFEFPFNNPKKSAEIAFAEIRKGLSELPETSLLFLTHLGSISWQINNVETGNILRHKHTENHFEVLKLNKDKTTISSHFLKFDRPVEGIEKQRTAVAFELDFLPNVRSLDTKKSLVSQMKITPATPGRVAVFFPADKEASGLRFHLHAPFVPELSRASIKATPANLPLFEQLASLAAAALHQIRDLGLLTHEFLEVLPNSRDSIADRYDAIRIAILAEMNEQPLTPTQSKSHAPARHLLQGQASLKSLLSDKDIEYLVDYEDVPLQWVASAAQRNSNADRLLEDLDIGQWTVEDFVDLLRNKTATDSETDPTQSVTAEQVISWLGGKSAAWCQELYSLLLTEHLEMGSYRREGFAAELGAMRIVRLTDGSHHVASECFFTSDGGEHEEVMLLVDPEVYSSGRGKTQKQNARIFLEEIGVREVGEPELVEMILKQRYTLNAEIPDERIYRKDLKRFIALVEAKSEQAKLFSKYFIIECGDQWRAPDEVFLDRPFLETGLGSYFEALGEAASRYALCEDYQNCGIAVDRLIAFLLAVGATDRLLIVKTSCRLNPEAPKLVRTAPGNWSQRYGIDVDYHIPRLDELLEVANEALSRLIWKTLCEQEDESWTTARYRNNSTCPTRTAPSQLVCTLTDQAWIPQADGRFVRPAEATRDLLPAGFPFDPGWEWLEAIGFGNAVAERSAELCQRQALVKDLGFGDEAKLERAKRFIALPDEVQMRVLTDLERNATFNLPDHEPANPSRRSERVMAQANDAPERLTERRSRSVSIGLESVKQDAGQYLHQQYTNADGEMICQVCKNRLPFKLDDGSDYFERVEFLRDLNRRHPQNYLALCPNHAAMFQHANGSSGELRGLVTNLSGNEMPVVLAKEDSTIYFTKTHLLDIKAIVSADLGESESTDDEPLDAINT